MSGPRHVFQEINSTANVFRRTGPYDLEQVALLSVPTVKAGDKRAIALLRELARAACVYLDHREGLGAMPEAAAAEDDGEALAVT